jgi:hypothetical protein
MTKRSSKAAKAGENHQITIRANGPLNSQHPQGVTPELLTARQTAELCAVGERTLWVLVCDRQSALSGPSTLPGLMAAASLSMGRGTPRDKRKMEGGY